MAKYRLLSGSHSRKEADGLRHKYEAGDVLEMSEAEVVAFPKKFELLQSEEVALDVKRMSVENGLSAVEAGGVSAEEALDGEEGKKKPGV